MTKANCTVYDSRTAEIRSKIDGDRESYFVNQIYKAAEGNFYYFINQRGYYHILKPSKVKMDGKTMFFAVCEYLLTVDGKLSDLGYYDVFGTKEEVFKSLEKACKIEEQE